mmetsp:Transcript_10219/g.25050  ORF Transcript_10219/g.25050 Transcript_10219/m.25050 type:complete len:80 (+) Transcript_10219:283-522(+)
MPFMLLSVECVIACPRTKLAAKHNSNGRYSHPAFLQMSIAESSMLAKTTHPMDKHGITFDELGRPSSSRNRSCAARKKG